MDQLCQFQSGLEQHACEESNGKNHSNTVVFSCCFLSASDSIITTHSPLSLRSLSVTTAGTTPFTFHVVRTPQSRRHTAHCTPHTRSQSQVFFWVRVPTAESHQGICHHAQTDPNTPLNSPTWNSSPSTSTRAASSVWASSTDSQEGSRERLLSAGSGDRGQQQSEGAPNHVEVKCGGLARQRRWEELAFSQVSLAWEGVTVPHLLGHRFGLCGWRLVEQHGAGLGELAFPGQGRGTFPECLEIQEGVLWRLRVLVVGLSRLLELRCGSQRDPRAPSSHCSHILWTSLEVRLLWLFPRGHGGPASAGIESRSRRACRCRKAQRRERRGGSASTVVGRPWACWARAGSEST